MRITALLSFLLLVTGANAQHIHKKIVFFGYDNAKLETPTIEKMESFYDRAEDGTHIRYELLGLLDENKSHEENNQLLKDRMESLKAFYVAKGMTAEDFSVTQTEVNPMLLSKGEARDGLCSYLVDVHIRKFAVPDKFETLAQIDPVKVQKKKVDPKKKLRIEGKEGTIIKAKRKCFMFADGTPVEDPVTIELKEFYNTSDWLTEGLVTTCNGRMIESGGMIHIAATCKGQEVFLKPGNNLSIELPLKGDEYKEGMQTFLGSKKGDIIDWGVAPIASSVPASEIGVVPGNLITNSINVDNYIYNDDNRNYNSRINIRGGRGGNRGWMGGLKNALGGELDEYLIQSGELGWINCDRFYEVENKGNMLVNLDTAMRPVVRLVFEDINSVMPGMYNGDTDFSFNNIPTGYKATLVAYTLKNDQPYLAMKKVTIDPKKKIKLRMEEVSMAELKEALGSMDSKGG